jgi:hypothetical protein
VSTELANKAYAYLLTALTDVTDPVIEACAHLLITLINVTDLVIKADLFVYSIIAKLCYTFIMFIRIMVNISVFKKSIVNYK